MLTNASWYAITTRPNGERRAHEDLRREQVTTFFPRNRCRTIRKLKSGPVVKWVEKPAYPRYLFVQLAAPRWWTVRKAHCQFVALDPVEDDDGFVTVMPTVIPSAIMHVIMAGFDATGLALASKSDIARKRFQALQQVRITDGVLKDCLASVIDDDGGDKIRVLLNALGKTTVPAEHLEAA